MGLVLTALVAAFCLGAPASAQAPPPPPPPNEAIADKKVEAQRLARELDERGREVSILAEQFNQARLEAERLGEEVSLARVELRRTEAEVAETTGRLKERMVSAYVNGAPPPALAVVLGGPVDEMAVRRIYVNAVAGQEQTDIEDLQSAQERNEARQREVQQAQEAAGAVAAEMKSRRRAAELATAAQRRALSDVQGELAALVEGERARRAEEEAQQAEVELAAREVKAQQVKAELAASQARANARQAVETTTTAVPRTTTTVGDGPGTTTATTRAAGGATTTSTARVGTSSSATTTRPPTTTTRLALVTVTTAAPDDEDEAPATTPPPAPGGATAVAEARRQLGKPYEWGGSGPGSFDCSGLTSWAWRAAGKSLPHSSAAQMSVTTKVPVSQVEVGDLLFYGSPVHHVGIYAGDGMMVEASQTGTPVRMASIFRRDLVGVGRVK